ncbi:MAG: ATP-grasp domain-containing protein [Bacillota bacterium]
MAYSANSAGFKAISIDYFGDLDQKRMIKNISLVRDLDRDFSAENLVLAAMDVPAGFLIYGANLENYPQLIDLLSTKHTILGNSSQALKKARSIASLTQVLGKTDFSIPKSLFAAPQEEPAGRWLIKPSLSGGGIGIRQYKKNETVKKGEYLQQFVEGKTLSAVFLADGAKCLLLGITEQIVGAREYGADGYKWAGNIFPWNPMDEQFYKRIWEKIYCLIKILSKNCGLKGLNCIDFILNDTGIHLLEVNPRFSGSVELLERYFGLSLLPWHITACMDGILPDELDINLNKEKTIIKAVLYAEEDIVITDSDVFDRLLAHDIPHKCDRIDRGSPMCTIIREGKTREECLEIIWSAVEQIKGCVYSYGS